MKKHDKELHAMKVCAMALAKLTTQEKRRVIAWLDDATDDTDYGMKYSGLTETVE